ncbi:hypothetical protein ACFO8O_16265 [Hephaestia sp. GCM10023244]|uniref:hypothetical protein n=1 Tax=unclassified Hephaestia TaxID=2631281 RepID=UPI002076F50D|nr:hypothetical protein [Hephaestia sp. MAHUQ-44]MCM8732515.1 hypothetical protein [Hephaestia sp. MAHUQ-44]
MFEAADADDALVILGDGADVHLLVLDIDMPDSMDGYNSPTLSTSGGHISISS